MTRPAVEAFLRRFHDSRPGLTTVAFGDLPVTMHGRRYASSYEVLAGQVPAAPSHVLDLACGDGPLLALLAARGTAGLTLTGIDMSPGELGAARERVGDAATLLQARAQALPLPDASVDVLLSHMALMLMDDVPAVLREAARVLRPGGTLAAVVGAGMAPTPALTCYLEVLAGHARAAEWAEVRFGDRRLRSAEGIAELLAPAFDGVQVHELQAPRHLTPDALWAALLDMYDLHLLEEGARAQVRQQLLARLEPHRAADGTLAWTTQLRFFKGRKR
jgi:SAM-dependent methyltransferase